MTEHDCRLFFSLLRNGLEHDDQLQHLHRWLDWDGKPVWADLVARVRSLSFAERDELARALSTGQLESKYWLVDLMRGLVTTEKPLNVCVVGGWCGLLPLLLSLLKPFAMGRIAQVDLDERANLIANRLCWRPDAEVKFQAVTGDALDFDYSTYHVVINTSCEHFPAEVLNRWLKRLPSSRYVFLQSNDFFSEPTHVNCHQHVFEFRKSVDFRTCLYTGEMRTEKYRRFMIAGVTHAAP